MRILITGGAGFIGTNLIKTLKEQKPEAELFVIDNYSTGYESNQQEGVEYYHYGIEEHTGTMKMEDINPEFATTDVVLVLGANDVVNPAAKEDPASPIFGMPILTVEDAAHTVINKRSMNVGYAGIDNDLFYRDKSSMLFGDAKKVLTELVSELKAL